MKQGLLIATASAVLLAIPAIASADDDAGWYLRANIGYGIHQDLGLDRDLTDNVGNGIQSEGNAAFSWGVGYDFSNNWRVELDGDSLWTDLGSISGVDQTSAKLRTSSAMLNVLYDFDDFGNWSPFVGAGVGLVRSKADLTALESGGANPVCAPAGPPLPAAVCRVSDSDINVGAQGLAGLSYDISDNLRWDTHYSYQLSRDADFDGFRSGGGPLPFALDVEGESIGAHSLVTGFRYLWGQKAAAPIPVAAQQWRCWDSSVVSTQSECPVKPQTWTCYDGSIVSDVSNCAPPPAAVEQPAWTCWDGSIVYQENSCPAQISQRGNDVAALCSDQFRQEIIYYEFDKGQSAETRATIGRILDTGQYCNVDNIRVVGHTDSSGSAAYNLSLSKQRAKDARDELVRQGIAENRITSEGKGETELFVQTGDGVKEQLNRRTEVLITLGSVGVIN